MTDKTFTGFVPPTANYSKLPHQLINELPQITTLGEMKVLLYVLRHTWGYQEFDEGKKITLDEFENGRRRRNKPRMDNGTGLAKSTIIEGLKRAVEHGFLIVETDSSDKARVKKYYMLNLVSENQTVGVVKSNTDGMETIQRTEKETIRKKQKKVAPGGAASIEDDIGKSSIAMTITITDEGYVSEPCPWCDGQIVLTNLSKTAAVCPHCETPLWVTDVHGVVRIKPPQQYRNKRKKKVIGDIVDGCPGMMGDIMYYAGDKQVIELLVAQNRDMFLECLSWAAGKMAKGHIRPNNAVKSAITWMQDRLKGVQVVEKPSAKPAAEVPSGLYDFGPRG